MKRTINLLCIALLLCISATAFAQLPVKEMDAIIKTYKKKKGFGYDSFGKMELKMIEPVMDYLSKRENLDDETKKFIDFMSIFIGATSVKSLDSEEATPELRAEFFANMSEIFKDSPAIEIERPVNKPECAIFSAYGIAIDANSFSEVIFMDEAQGTFAYLKGAIPLDTVIKLSQFEDLEEFKEIEEIEK